MKKKQQQQGFTLIDALITAAVIVVVVLAGLIILERFGKSVADNRRIADINRLQGALERYYRNCGTYPTDLSRVSEPADGSGSCSVNLLTFINPIPDDPVTDEPYIYDVSRTNYAGEYYCLATDLANEDHPKANAAVVSFPPVVEISCKGDYIVTSWSG